MAGHMYYKDDNGVIHTNSRDLYRGIDGAILISHGEWSDPEVVYQGISINYNDIEDMMWDEYGDDVRSIGEQQTINGYEDWLANQGKDYIIDALSYQLEFAEA